jgi:hypothetical protein
MNVLTTPPQEGTAYPARPVGSMLAMFMHDIALIRCDVRHNTSQ